MKVRLFGVLFRNALTNISYHFHYPGTVCIGFLNKFSRRLKEREVDTSNQDAIEIELFKACKDTKNKEERFVSECLYLLKYSLMQL